jgi:TonB family protein
MSVLINCIAYACQVLAIVAVAGVTLKMLKLRDPRYRLGLLQGVLATCLLLPWFEPFVATEQGSVSAWTLSATAVGTNSAIQHSSFDWGFWLIAILCAGAIVRLGLVAIGLIRLRSRRLSGRPLRGVYEALAARLGVRAEYLAVPDIAGPATYGWVKPVVLLPEQFAGNEAIVCHELIHIRRRDWLSVLVEQAIRSVFWFHPAIWWLVDQIQLAREQVVDREVVRLLGARESYLEALLAVASSQARMDWALSPAFLRKRFLHSRIHLLTRHGAESRKRLVSSAAGLALLTALTVWTGARLMPLQAEAAPAPSDSPAAASAPPSNTAKQDSSKPIRVSGAKQEENLIKKVMPKYPVEAKKNHVQGKVFLDVIISKEGRVESTRLISGPALLVQSAVDAVKQWEYKPTLLNGEPVAIESEVLVHYTLSK